MNKYPEVVEKILSDYLERLKLQLRLVPAREQGEFLREIESHLFEAYQREPGEDDVTRILSVLRKLGEPAEVVSDRLPEAMTRNGTKRHFPMYIVGGILIALFGVPLGFGAVAIVIGILAALSSVLVAYYAVAGTTLLTGLMSLFLGMIRITVPELWDKLILYGLIHIEGRAGEVFEILSPAAQGSLFIIFGATFAAAGLGLLWLGRYLFRGLRFI